MRALKLIIIAITPIVFSSCSAFGKSGDINNFVGEYSVIISRERTYHVYWNEKKLKRENEIDPRVGASIYIMENKQFDYIDLDGNLYRGKVRCFENYVCFAGTPIDSSYKFYLKNNEYLEYSYESFHVTLEYDVTYRVIRLVK